MAQEMEQIEISADTKVMIDGLIKMAKGKVCEIEWLNGLITGLIIRERGTVEAERLENLKSEIWDVYYDLESINGLFEKPYINVAVSGGPFDANP
jgi:hypothetical protein